MGHVLRAQLQCVIAPGSHLEREYPKTGPRELPFNRQLRRKSGDPYLGRRVHESGHFFPRKRSERNLHCPGICPANDRNMFHDRQHKSAPPVGLTEPNGRAALWQPVYERRCRHAALSRIAALDSTPGVQWRNCRGKLHVVPLHLDRSYCQQHRQRRTRISRSQ